MTRHDNYVLEEWLNNAVEEHEEGADTSSLPPAYVIDLLLELRHHRAAADEAAWDHQRAEEAEEEEIAYAHAQAHAATRPPLAPVRVEGLRHLPQDDGIIWTTPQGGQLRWDPDVAKWALTNPAGNTTARYDMDQLVEVLTSDDFPLSYTDNP